MSQQKVQISFSTVQQYNAYKTLFLFTDPDYREIERGTLVKRLLQVCQTLVQEIKKQCLIRDCLTQQRYDIIKRDK